MTSAGLRAPGYNQARAALDKLHGELAERNQSAAASLEEGLEETLTLHRLGVYGVLGRSFKTTNCLESINAWSRNGALSIIGRTRVSGSAGWRPRSSTSNRA